MASSGKTPFWESVGFLCRVAFVSVRASAPLAAFFAVPFALAVVVATEVSARLAALAPRALDAPLPAFAAALPALIVASGSVVLAFAVVYPLVTAGIGWIAATAAAGDRATFPRAAARLSERGPVALGAWLGTVLAVAAAPVALGTLAIVAGAALGARAAAVFLLLAFVSIVYPGLLLVIRLSLAGVVAMVEHVDVPGALGRSWTLVRGGYWWVAGIFVVSGAFAALVSAAVSSPFAYAELPGAGGIAASAAGQTLGTIASTWLAGVTAGVVYVLRASAHSRDL